MVGLNYIHSIAECANFGECAKLKKDLCIIHICCLLNKSKQQNETIIILKMAIGCTNTLTVGSPPTLYGQFAKSHIHFFFTL